MAGAHPPMSARPQHPGDWAEAAVVRDPWAGWRFGMALPPAGPFVYPFPQVPPQDAVALRQPEPVFGYERTWLGSRYVRPQIPEEAVARPAVEPGGYTVDELLGGNVRRKLGMNSNIPAAGK
jgi:hypothetical protein